MIFLPLYFEGGMLQTPLGPKFDSAFVKTGINLSEEVCYLGLWLSQCLSPQGKGNHFREVFVNSVEPTYIMLKYNSPSVWLQLIFFNFIEFYYILFSL